MAKIAQVFFDVDMRNGHDGLRKIASKNDIQIDTLDQGTFIVFINRKQNMVKVFAPSNVVAFYKCPNIRGRIDTRTIPNVIRAFQSKGSIDYDEVLKTHLESRLKRPSQAHV